MAKMYGWEKPLREEKSRKNPSFSSTLLDEIYRSIDGRDEKMGEVKLQKDNIGKKQSCNGGGGCGGGGGRAKSSRTVEDEEMASLRRACLIEKWMEKKVNEKASRGSGRRRSSLQEFDRRSVLDNDPLFFSSSSSSSESSLGFNEPDVFNAAKSKPSCFAPFRPKPVKTSVSAKSAKQNDFYLFDDDCRTNKIDDGLIRSKARALKIYASLKKVKQPISPGGRLTSFLNSIFANGNGKKGKDLNSPKVYEDVRAERKSKSIQGSTCSSASSFSRSCLSKTSPRSREKLSNGVKRTVRFYPVSVIVDEDCRPCGQKVICDEDLDNFGRSLQLQRNEEFQLQHKGEKNYNVKELSRNCQNHKENDYLATNINDGDCDDFDDDDDMASEASSDLFELDHLKVFKDDRFCEELPVYETTHFGTNRAIESGLIR